ncbi:hypothetical protein A8B81_14995 [Sulfitobacter pontiacus]|uniref:site-specific integrase n=1 Tax=Sulfitobacter pontiacus TaxID=60137 RepID=UPI0007D8DFF9|nr:site-specific integrase [Sulfitobacter pontiacus]OAN77936.1 hypothetical protein A8B81_14995 [Sulfitobacter pontiacus]
MNIATSSQSLGVAITERIPLILKFEAWPNLDRVAWDNLFLAGDFFDDVGPCQSWSDGGRAKRCQSDGQWLSFLYRSDAEALSAPPAHRITMERVRAFVTECDERLAPRSIQGLVTDLYILAKALAPQQDWAWLNMASKHMLNQTNRHSLPAPYPIMGSEILRWSLNFMARTVEETRLSAKKQAIHYRQALLIGFLISCPIRRRTLLAMRVGSHLRPMSDGFTLKFAAEDVKDRKARNFRLPKRLVEPMRTYLEQYRPLLLSGKDTDALWVNQYGEGITADGLSRELPKITERYLGVALRSHTFRHIVATTIAEFDPKHAGIIRDILGHATLAMSQKHYNRATGISSCNGLQSIVEDIRKSMPIIGGAKRALTPKNGVSEPE